MLRLLSKHLAPAQGGQAMGMPPPQQQLQQLRGTHKAIYLGETQSAEYAAQINRRRVPAMSRRNHKCGKQKHFCVHALAVRPAA